MLLFSTPDYSFAKSGKEYSQRGEPVRAGSQFLVSSRHLRTRTRLSRPDSTGIKFKKPCPRIRSNLYKSRRTMLKTNYLNLTRNLYYPIRSVPRSQHGTSTTRPTPHSFLSSSLKIIPLPPSNGLVLFSITDPAKSLGTEDSVTTVICCCSVALSRLFRVVDCSGVPYSWRQTGQAAEIPGGSGNKVVEDGGKAGESSIPCGSGSVLLCRGTEEERVLFVLLGVRSILFPASSSPVIQIAMQSEWNVCPHLGSVLRQTDFWEPSGCSSKGVRQMTQLESRSSWMGGSEEPELGVQTGNNESSCASVGLLLPLLLLFVEPRALM